MKCWGGIVPVECRLHSGSLYILLITSANTVWNVFCASSWPEDQYSVDLITDVKGIRSIFLNKNHRPGAIDALAKLQLALEYIHDSVLIVRMPLGDRPWLRAYVHQLRMLGLLPAARIIHFDLKRNFLRLRDIGIIVARALDHGPTQLLWGHKLDLAPSLPSL